MFQIFQQNSDFFMLHLYIYLGLIFYSILFYSAMVDTKHSLKLSPGSPQIIQWFQVYKC